MRNTGTVDNTSLAAEQASLAQVLAIEATLAAVKTRAAEMGIRVLKDTAPGVEPVGAGAEPGDMYGNGDCADYAG